MLAALRVCYAALCLSLVPNWTTYMYLCCPSPPNLISINPSHFTMSPSVGSRMSIAFLAPPSPIAFGESTAASPLRSQSPVDDQFTRKPRPPRPSYSEEQKFYIMYARVLRDLPWPEIEDDFAQIFGSRSKGGLTSVYYRIRRSWGLEEVQKGSSESTHADRMVVQSKVTNFSRDFLIRIGYLR